MISNNYTGKLIVFEGPDGSGKTTLMGIAKEYLDCVGLNCCLVKMPSNRVRNLNLFQNLDISNDIRERNAVSLFNMTVFVSGDRLITMDTEIMPALKRGEIVLCDRYCYTGYVRCNDNIIFKLCKRFIRPNLTILLEASAEVLKNRVKSRENEKELFYDDDNVKLQIKRFRSLAQKNNFKIVNTEQSQSLINETLYSFLNKIIN